jgi:excisionase family DNA binding protein
MTVSRSTLLRGAGFRAGDVFLTVQELADMLHVSVQWVYAHKDEITYCRAGRRILFTYDDVTTYLETSRSARRLAG